MPGRERSPEREDEHPIEWRDRRRVDDAFAESAEDFDRIAFASDLLRILAPRGITVVFHDSYHGVRVERGRDYARGGKATWAMVGISPSASREWIALAMAEVAGVERIPFVVDWLVASCRTPGSV